MNGKENHDLELDAEIARLKQDYPHLTPGFSGPHGDSWTCNLQTMTMMYGLYGIYAGGGTTKLAALLDARRHPDEQKAEKARLAVIEEQAKAAAAAREKALDDAVFASI